MPLFGYSMLREVSAEKILIVPRGAAALGLHFWLGLKTASDG